MNPLSHGCTMIRVCTMARVPSVHHDPSPECAPMRSECAWGVIQRSEIYNLVLESIFVFNLSSLFSHALITISNNYSRKSIEFDLAKYYPNSGRHLEFTLGTNSCRV